MNESKLYSKIILATFFIIYLSALTWIVLFKMSTLTTIHELVDIRVINLNLFRGIRYGYINNMEFLGNIIVFIPFGIYIGVLARKTPFMLKMLSGFVLSLCYETLQYIFAIGRSDITDIFLNGFGTLIGLLGYVIFQKCIKNTEKAQNIVAICSVAVSLPSMFVLMLLVM